MATTVENDITLVVNGEDKKENTIIERDETGRSRRLSQLEDEDKERQALLLAATLVEDAKSHRDVPFEEDPISVRSYRLYNNFLLRWGLYLAVFVNLSLALFEKPAVWPAPYWATIIVEIVVHCYYIFRFLHCRHFSTNKFWKDKKHYVVLIVIILTGIDIITYILWINLAPDKHPVRLTRALRPLYIVNFAEGRQVRRAFRNIRRTLPDIANVLVLFFFSVLIFALLGLKLFDKRNLTDLHGDDYFGNYWDSIWQLYVLVTTANDPDVMMPAYDQSNWFAVFFIIYIVVCLFIFMSILLAVIYNNYKKHLKNEVQRSVLSKRFKLKQAFSKLKVFQDGQYKLTKQMWVKLMKIVVPNRSEAQVNLLLHVLDEDEDDCLVLKEFLSSADLLNVELTEVKDRLTFLELYCPNIYLSRGSDFFKLCVKHKYFRYFFDFMILVNAVFIGFDIEEAEWFFLVLFTLEIVMKMYTWGPKEFFHVFWNVFDFVVIFSALIATIVEAATGAWAIEGSTLDILLVLRVLRLIKIIGGIKRFKVIILTILNIGPSIVTYGGVIFIFYYIYAIIGMEAFQGLIKYSPYNITNNASLICGNPALTGSEFARDRYCSNNFNNIMKSFVLLFELTVVNQWHVLTSGFVLVTHKAARIYFFMFHLTCVVIILNIFTAFILEAFILEYNFSKGKFEHRIEQKIKELGFSLGQKEKPKKKVHADKNDLICNMEDVDESQTHFYEESEEDIHDMSHTKEEGLKFHLRKKGRKKVEVLLQYMFENELGPENTLNIGDIDELQQQDVKPYPLTLDNVT